MLNIFLQFLYLFPNVQNSNGSSQSQIQMVNPAQTKKIIQIDSSISPTITYFLTNNSQLTKIKEKSSNRWDTDLINQFKLQKNVVQYYNIMQSESESLITKTFIFQNERSLKSENLEIAFRADFDSIDIKYIINIWKHKNQTSVPMQFKIYDPEINRYVALNTQIPLRKAFLYSPVIMIKYKEIGSFNHFDDDIQSIASSKASSETKRQRNRERTIKEVLEYVKQWRAIHNTFDKHKNKINLQEAAKIIGISKKSLDDYYCQLRLAELYGFNFEANIEEKIGVLRNYVKQHRLKGQEGNKHQRLPKKLRILQQIETSFKSKQMLDQNKMQQEQPVQSVIQARYEPPLAVIPEDQYQNRFYNSFNFMLSQPEDPFNVFQIKNSTNESMSYSQLPYI